MGSSDLGRNLRCKFCVNFLPFNPLNPLAYFDFTQISGGLQVLLRQLDMERIEENGLNPPTSPVEEVCRKKGTCLVVIVAA